MSTTKFITVAGKRIPYEVFPARLGLVGGPTFVCLPGLGDLRSEYRYLQPLLSATAGRVILSDLRGLGEESGDRFQSHTPDDSGRDILSLLETENVTDAILVGCSFAGASVVYAAAKAPSRVRGVVLLSPFAWDHPMPFGMLTLLRVMLSGCTGPGFWASYYKGLHKRAAAVPDLDAHVARVKARLGSAPGGAATVFAQIAASKAACAAELPTVAAARLPALVVYGAKDPDFPDVAREAAEAAARLGSGAVTRTVPDAGHYPHVDDPAEVAAAILEFARGIDARRAATAAPPVSM